MYDMFDYLEWRGDIPFAKVGPNPVDFLIFSTLSYVQFDGIVSEGSGWRISLREAAERFFAQTDLENKVRVKKDLELLEAAANTERFGCVGVACYRSRFVPEEEKQFSAITYFLGDGTAVLTYRGTDRSLVGWKEDFNMSFCDSIPAQKEALKYLEDFAVHNVHSMYLTGHSKGGNLAMYAAAKAETAVQQRILDVHSMDGPGFTESVMNQMGYLAVSSKIHSYVPQSSIVGILFEQVEPYAVIKSKQIGPMQHDPYSWEVLRNDFIYLNDISSGAKFMDQTTRDWLKGMTPEQRNELVDVVYEILTSGGAVRTDDLIHPRQFASSVMKLAADEKKREVIGERLADLVKAILAVQRRK